MLLAARNVIRNIMLYLPYYHTLSYTHDIYDIFLQEKKHITLSDANEAFNCYIRKKI